MYKTKGFFTALITISRGVALLSRSSSYIVPLVATGRASCQVGSIPCLTMSTCEVASNVTSDIEVLPCALPRYRLYDVAEERLLH